MYDIVITRKGSESVAAVVPVWTLQHSKAVEAMRKRQAIVDHVQPNTFECKLVPMEFLA